jgi:hypothetical protein
MDEGRAWIKEAAGQGFGKAQALAAQLPALPERETPQASRGLESGLNGLQKSWTGYVDLVNSLDKLSGAASK